MCDFINKFKHFEQRQINKLTEMIGKMTEITNPNPNVEKNECNESLAPRVAIWFHGPSILLMSVASYGPVVYTIYIKSRPRL